MILKDVRVKAVKPKELDVKIVVHCPEPMKTVTVKLDRPADMDDAAWEEFLKTAENVVNLMNAEEEALGGVIHEP